MRFTKPEEISGIGSITFAYPNKDINAKKQREQLDELLNEMDPFTLISAYDFAKCALHKHRTDNTLVAEGHPVVLREGAVYAGSKVYLLHNPWNLRYEKDQRHILGKNRARQGLTSLMINPLKFEIFLDSSKKGDDYVDITDRVKHFIPYEEFDHDEITQFLFREHADEYGILLKHFHLFQYPKTNPRYCEGLSIYLTESAFNSGELRTDLPAIHKLDHRFMKAYLQEHTNPELTLFQRH